MPYHLVRWFYTGLYTALAPFILALLTLRPDSRRRMIEYLAGPARRAPGPLSERTGRPRVWLHAVSVGEALSALPILAELRAHWPDMEVHLTTTIEDALIVALRSGTPFVSARFLPLDLPPLMQLTLARLRPDLALISETDFWPNMLAALASHGIPAFLTNGRVSYKIAGLYARLGAFSPRMFGAFTHAFVQAEQDASRLQAIGVPATSVTICGNTKYETALRPLPPGDHEPALAALQADPRRRVIAGSTHQGEEVHVLPIAQDAQLLLVLVPRIIGRAAAVLEQARAAGLAPVLFTALTPTTLAAARAVVVDVLGVLPRLYEGATVAYIGGGLDGSGGHNFLEAARFAVPIVTGDRMRNFLDDVAEFRRHSALEQVSTGAAVAPALATLLARPDRARAIGEAGAQVLRAHRGAAAATAAGILARVHVPGVTDVSAGPGVRPRA